MTATTATIIFKQRKTKSFKDISLQCERIFTLHINKGFGTNKMFNTAENIYFRMLQSNGY